MLLKFYAFEGAVSGSAASFLFFTFWQERSLLSLPALNLPFSLVLYARSFMASLALVWGLDCEDVIDIVEHDPGCRQLACAFPASSALSALALIVCATTHLPTYFGTGAIIAVVWIVFANAFLVAVSFVAFRGAMSTCRNSRAVQFTCGADCVHTLTCDSLVRACDKAADGSPLPTLLGSIDASWSGVAAHKSTLYKLYKLHQHNAGAEMQP